MKTLVMGAAIIDIIMKIKRLPKSGEDVLCNETKTVVGGCAYNVASMLKNFEAEHDLFVPVGTGMYADMIAGHLKSCGYRIMIHDEEMDNGYCLCLVEEGGERTFITVKGSEGRFVPSWFSGIDSKNYQIIYLAGYQVCGGSGKVLADWLVQQEEKTVFFAPGPVIAEINGEVMEQIFALKPVIHLNEKEAFDFTGGADISECLHLLYQRSGNLVIVTLGDKGTMYYDGVKCRLVEAFETVVADTIGAGDSHVAAVIAGYSKGWDMERCIRTANMVASGIVKIEGPTMGKELFDKYMQGVC